jgi:hypothetical protein
MYHCYIIMMPYNNLEDYKMKLRNILLINVILISSSYAQIIDSSGQAQTEFNYSTVYAFQNYIDGSEPDDSLLWRC